jgi:transposase
MAKPLVSDSLWAALAPLIPARRRPRAGRPPIDDRAALTGILFVLKSGIPWEMLPREMGCGSGMTCWRRLHEWQRAGVWEQLRRELAARLDKAERIDWDRAVRDSVPRAAKNKKGARRSARARRIPAHWAESAIRWPTVRGGPPLR